MKFLAHCTEPGSIESDYSLKLKSNAPIMSEVPLLFNGDPLSKFEAQTDLESAAGCAATEMIGLPEEIDDVLAGRCQLRCEELQRVGECRSDSAEKESIPDA